MPRGADANRIVGAVRIAAKSMPTVGIQRHGRELVHSAVRRSEVSFAAPGSSR
jgi:hypothetical protein